MRYEAMCKILKQINITFSQMECKRKKGKWYYSCRLNIEGGMIHYLIPRDDGYNDIGHFICSGNNPNEIVRELFNRIMTKEIIFRTYGIVGEAPDYLINWDESSNSFKKTIKDLELSN